MEEGCLIDSLAELLRVPERWMIQDDKGNIHELADGIKGTPVLISAKQEIYRLYFGKERINGDNLRMLDEIHTALMQFVWDNFSYKIKTDCQEELELILDKYGLKKVKKRAIKDKK